MDEEAQMSKAVELSMNDAKNNNFAFDLSPEQKVRKSGVPVGLKNIGNSNTFSIQLVILTPCFRPIFRTSIS